MDPRTPPVTVQVNGTLAQLLVRLMNEAGTEDATGLLSRALGLYDLALHAKKGGRRVVLYDERTGDVSDIPI